MTCPGRRARLTAAARDIARAVVHALAAERAEVHATDIESERFCETAAGAESAGQVGVTVEGRTAREDSSIVTPDGAQRRSGVQSKRYDDSGETGPRNKSGVEVEDRQAVEDLVPCPGNVLVAPQEDRLVQKGNLLRERAAMR